jgi:hypothetical protein
VVHVSDCPSHQRIIRRREDDEDLQILGHVDEPVVGPDVTV